MKGGGALATATAYLSIATISSSHCDDTHISTSGATMSLSRSFLTLVSSSPSLCSSQKRGNAAPKFRRSSLLASASRVQLWMRQWMHASEGARRSSALFAVLSPSSRPFKPCKLILADVSLARLVLVCPRLEACQAASGGLVGVLSSPQIASPISSSPSQSQAILFQTKQPTHTLVGYTDSMSRASVLSFHSN